MGWYLLRKPYPGFEEEDRVNITHDVILVGRGRECTKLCLSIFVSRRHLLITPKKDGSLTIQDLGSSNGTFINESRINSLVEWPLKVGDEIGIGNINADDKDCYVYRVHESTKDPNQDLKNEINSELHDDRTTEGQNTGHLNMRHNMDRGLKRFATDPDVILVDDDLKKENVSVANLLGESMAHHVKRPKTDDVIDLVILENLPEASSCGPSLEAEKLTRIENSSSVKVENAGRKETSNICSVQDLSHKASVSPSGLGHNSSPLVNIIDAKVHGSNTKDCVKKAKDPRLSVLLNKSCDTSSGTVKLSSPSSVTKGLSMPSCSTPYLSKHITSEDVQPVLTSAPCLQSETSVSSISRCGNLSPIVKEIEPRQSQGSSFNYTLDEEIIPIDVSDDEDVFPCSQMFVEEDVKPSISDLRKEVDFVDLSLDEDNEVNKEAGEDNLDEVIVLGSSDEDEDEIADADRWYQRLSQSSIKIEVDYASINQRKEAAEEEFEPKEANSDVCVHRAVPLDTNEPCNIDKELKEIDSRQQEEFINETNALSDNVFEKESRAQQKLKCKTEEMREEKQKDERHRSKHKKRDKERDKSKKKDDFEKREESKSHKHKKRHSHHESKKTREESKSYFISKKSKKVLVVSDSDEEPIDPSELKRETSPESPPEVKCVTPDAFDELLRSHDKISKGQEPSKHQEKELTISLNRLENDVGLCKQYGLSSNSVPAASSSVSSVKKVSRRTELVAALPNPPRKAFNRGISIESTKMLKNGKTVDDKSIHGLKSSKHQDKDPKIIRKEKLAQVAALRASKEKESSDSKRTAPARVKNTATNRGSFLTEEDETSPMNKPKSRNEIVRSMKIPKVKDKVTPASSYPSKSPLQSMNLSWEKDKVRSIVEPHPSTSLTAPQRPESKPVEIPTGPQPKKRVAQVAPPGYYKDACSLPETSLPMPIKSSLVNSSKHNIALNKSKPNKKKTVRFKENMVEVFWIDSIPHTKPVNSYKDADKPKPMSQVPSAVNPKAMIMLNDEATLQDVIYDICKWNPLWLKEEKNLPSNTLPPVVSNMDLPTVPPTEFLDFDEYHNTMYPLLMLELWNGVSRDYNNHHNDSRSNIMMAVDSASSSAVVSRPDRMLTTLNCHMPIYERNGRVDHPRLGHLVIIDLRLKDPSGKLCIIPVFGYVSYASKDRAFNTDTFHRDLVPRDKGMPAFKVRFSLLIRERKNLTYMLEKPMQIKNVTYIRGDLRMFVAMKNLQYMPLRYSIISPNAGNEDLSLPDISKEKLAPEVQLNAVQEKMLNPIQEKIVLQTGEVCRQSKPKICLIQGPPGTGKSHVIANLVLQLLYRNDKYTKANRGMGLVPRILLCAPSNTAIDVLVRRLLRRRQLISKEDRFKMVRVGNADFMHNEVKGISLIELARIDVQRNANMDNIRIEKSNLQATLQKTETLIRDLTIKNKAVPDDLKFRNADIIRKLRVLEERLKEQSNPSKSNNNYALNKESMKKILRGADIVATTLTSCVINIMETVFPPPTSQNNFNFQVCIVDESTQCLEVETLIPLMLGVKTLVLVGDHKQLPATVLSKAAKEKGLGTSLFARLQKIVPHAVQMLDTQYRMHPEILKWPNKYYYSSCLRTPDKLLKNRESKIRPYTIISLPFQQDVRGEANNEEAKLVLLLAELLIDKEAIPQSTFSVGIIAPYRSQCHSIKSRLPQHLTDKVEVNTIDSYQGQEKDIIIFSCVRTSGVGFLSDRQRLNVALTRAKYGLFICGNFSSLDRDQMWNCLLTDARQRKCVIELRSQQWDKKEDLWDVIKRR